MSAKTYYVTKYALTQGIFVVDEKHAQESGEYLYIGEPNSLEIQVGWRDWFTTLEAAKVRIAELQRAKIKSLKKSLTKMASYVPTVEKWSP